MGKILVTGASGFIGSHLVDLLVKAGEKDRLRLLVLPGASQKNLSHHAKLDVMFGDIRNPQDVKKAMHGVEVVYHLAAKTVFEGGKYQDYEDTNVTGTQNLLYNCRNNHIQKFVFFSSIAVYGLPAFVGNIINWSETQPKKPSEPYGASKLEAERRVLQAHQSFGLPYTVIRPTTVYGPRDHQGILELYKAINANFYFQIGDGKNLMDYVFVKDLVRGARQAQLSPLAASDYILGTEKPVTSYEIAKSVAASIGKSIPRVQIPKPLALGLSYPVMYLSTIMGIRPPLFPKRVKILTTNCYFDTSKARKEIAYKPAVSFSKGAQITGKWLLDNHLL